MTVTREIPNSNRIKPAVGSAKGRRLSENGKLSPIEADDRKSGPGIQIGAHQNNLFARTPIGIGHPRRQLFEDRVFR